MTCKKGDGIAEKGDAIAVNLSAARINFRDETPSNRTLFKNNMSQWHTLTTTIIYVHNPNNSLRHSTGPHPWSYN